MKIDRSPAVILAIWLLHLPIIAQSADCRPPAQKVSYKVLFSTQTVVEPRTTVVKVYLDRKRFTIEKMIRIREQLRYDFCKEDRLSVFFYDMKRPRLVRSIDTAGTREEEIKGIYEFERDGKDELSFESFDNQVWRIEFKGAEYCVYKEN